MSDTYREFVRYFKATAISNGMGYNEVAELMNVHPNTIRNWWGLKSTMDGDAVLRCIRLVMGGYKCTK